MHLWIHDQKKIYDNVFIVWIPKPQVVFPDYDVINEAIVTNGDYFIRRKFEDYPDKIFNTKANTGVIF
uniref:Neur_chan_LBD domain-containing protein n=1 Tax=Strongyloides venezuelensis TaxID=75913 RepID=A0A0K0EZ41_STRVS